LIDLGAWASGDYEEKGSEPDDNEHRDDLKKRGILN
jgi:endogenous inhibitor of DNA gyrase (YacG/DUF329 family)